MILPYYYRQFGLSSEWGIIFLEAVIKRVKLFLVWRPASYICRRSYKESLRNNLYTHSLSLRLLMPFLVILCPSYYCSTAYDDWLNSFRDYRQGIFDVPAEDVADGRQ